MERGQKSMRRPKLSTGKFSAWKKKKVTRKFGDGT
jgi:hypothetical protein